MFSLDHLTAFENSSVGEELLIFNSQKQNNIYKNFTQSAGTQRCEQCLTLCSLTEECHTAAFISQPPPFLTGSTWRTRTPWTPWERGSSWSSWRPWIPWKTRRERTSRTTRQPRRQRRLWRRRTHGKVMLLLRH